MGKAKSIVITVLLAIAMALAAIFAFVSFDVANSAKRYNSILSNVSLGADFTGYAYTTIYPEGVITEADYRGLQDAYENSEDKEDATDPALYEKVGGLYVNKEDNPDVDALKADVKEDAEKLNRRFGEKGYSSYSVAVEDGLSIKISVPTYYSSAEYKGLDENGRSNRLSVAQSALNALTASGVVTLRTSDASIETKDADGNTKTYDMKKLGTDQWTDTAMVADSSNNAVKTYALTKDDVAPYFKAITGGNVGTTPVLTFKFTKEGREAIKEITTLVASSSSQTLYFFIGDTQLVGYSSCTAPIDSNSISLQTNDAQSANNIAVALNSAVKGDALTLNYGSVKVSAEEGDSVLPAILGLVACLLVICALAVFLIVKYKKLGALTSAIAVLFALIEVYALELLNITVTFAVMFTGLAVIGLFVASCAVVYTEVKRLTETGRTIQASVKEAYKNVLGTITDLHLVLVIVAVLLAAVGVGEVSACGLIAIVGVVASYVLYWFTRFMWYVTSSPERDKFKFAGLKRVVYEDD